MIIVRVYTDADKEGIGILRPVSPAEQFESILNSGDPERRGNSGRFSL